MILKEGRQKCLGRFLSGIRKIQVGMVLVRNDQHECQR